MSKNLLMVFTGDGKGKTTAALGQAFRAMGQGFRVCFVQFVKGAWRCGEQISARRFPDLLEFKVFGRGFLWDSDDLTKDEEVGRQGWEFAKTQIHSGEYRMVILDELTYLVNYMMIDEKEVLECLKGRPDNVHVVVTGRDAPRSIVRAADIVTVMGENKHHFYQGVMAQRGVEF
jgi:cob(I)alamin adenosyltransferase